MSANERARLLGGGGTRTTGSSYFFRLHQPKFPTRLRSLLTIISILLAAAGVYLYNAYTHRDLVDQLAHSIENLSTCASCQALLIPLISIAHLGDDKLFSTLVSFCTGLGIQDPEVCRGALGAQAPIIAHSLRSMSLGGPAATLFCAKTFGLCDDPVVRDWKDIPLPPHYSNSTAATINKGTRSTHTRLSSRSNAKRKSFQVIHISDLHIDREYTTGADAKCARNLCCRPNQPSDIPNQTQIPAGPYGHHNCDSPESLYISMLRALKVHAPNASFAMHTGDMVDHAVWTSVRKEVEEGIQQGHSQYHTYSKVPLYGVIGNHDVAPTNSFPRNTTITLSSQWDLELFSDTWARWIGDHGAHTLQANSGCYSRIHPGTNLKIISLNTGFWYKAVKLWLYDSDEFQPDPNGILAWLISELQDAENRGQKAWIIGHLSPGKADCLHEPSRYINQILRRYKHTIAAMFYGHTHRSEWEIVYEDPQHPTAENAIGIIYIGQQSHPNLGTLRSVLTRGADQPSDWKPCYSGECRKKWVHNLRSSQSEFNEYPNQVGLHIDTVSGSVPIKPKKGFQLMSDEEDGEHVCGDLASLYRHAKTHVLPDLQAKKVVIPDQLKREIRRTLQDS
ncbi:hypothetical protein KEM48_011203 [Puccinia striiformis f. sp. tritici PST-130]|nr:hypothetical protein KEM48_011203 [Puccinia striiformis f. sp. tritici PST-130]